MARNRYNVVDLLLAWWLILIVLRLFAVGGIVWIIVHFIVKFW